MPPVATVGDSGTLYCSGVGGDIGIGGGLTFIIRRIESLPGS